jgi:hypothetical protein
VIGRPAPIVDAAAVVADLRRVAIAVPLGNGQRAALSTLIAGMRPLGPVDRRQRGYRRPNRRIAACAGNREATILGKTSTQWRMGRR